MELMVAVSCYSNGIYTLFSRQSQILISYEIYLAFLMQKQAVDQWII